MRKGLWLILGLALAVLIAVRASQWPVIEFSQMISEQAVSRVAAADRPITIECEESPLVAPPLISDTSVLRAPEAAKPQPEHGPYFRQMLATNLAPRAPLVGSHQHQANSSDGFDSLTSVPSAPPFEPGPPIASDAGEPTDALSVDPGPLRRELMAAVARKLQLMSLDELRQNLHREKVEIRELQAEIQLTKARLHLEYLSDSYPETKAGRAATIMLQRQPGTNAPFGAAEAPLTPRPERFQSIRGKKPL